MEGGCLKQLVYAPMVFSLFLHINITPSLSLEYNHSNGTHVRCIERERQALLAFKQGVTGYGGYESELLSSWGGREARNQDCCRWRGVYCNNQTGHVTRLDLGGEVLSGEVTPKLIELQHLKYLIIWLDYGSKTPTVIGSLTNLRYLGLELYGFVKKFPYQLGNLTHLQYLSCSSFFTGSTGSVRIENLNWLPNLSSLKYLDLSYTNLSNVFDWPEAINKLPNLRNLTLRGCSLPPLVFPTLPHINSSQSLASVDLSANDLSTTTTSVFKWLCNYNTSLVLISMTDSNLNGSIPNVFGNMRSLAYLQLSFNNLEGEIPPSFANLSSMRFLDLEFNNLNGRYSAIIRILSKSAQNSLEAILLIENQNIYGPLPNLTNFSSLKRLSLSYTGLSGRVPESMGQMSKLGRIEMGSTSLEGTISETHFSQLSRLFMLDLSNNSLAFNVSANWVPPFQSEFLILRSCKLSPSFPKWLQTQKKVLHIDISNTGISDILPSWFWDWSYKATAIDLSQNQIRGTLGNMNFEFAYNPDLNLSWNLLEGPIHSTLLSNVSSMDLSNNKLSGSVSFFCSANVSYLTFLDLSSNNLSGELPNCWTNFRNLIFLDLSNNSFSGKVPITIGDLVSIESMRLKNNKFVGEFPSLKNCQNLNALDIEDNKFSGSIPNWVGVLFPKLAILILRSNLFNGSMPLQLCNLTNIRILDLSINNISGSIPKCLNNLTTLGQEENPKYMTISHEYTVDGGTEIWGADGAHYKDEVAIVWKGTLSRYKSTLALVKCIDLSSNRLIGEIPNEITHLAGLVSLNLSRNLLRGQISGEIGKLRSLQSLDLSRNQLYGTIPTSLFHIYGLGYLDLSHNNLSGKIPLGSQLQNYGASSFIGNPQLCGLPLERSCSLNPKNSPQDEEDELFTQGFYISVGLGFFAGFWGFCGSLIFIRPWRYSYYKFLNLLNGRLYVRIAVIWRKLKHRLP